jgi:EmrB/QacA subfamily drug resistance transporter
MTATHPCCDEGLARSARDVGQCAPQSAVAVLAATILASSMTFIDGSVVNVVLPVLRSSLSASAAQMQWIVEAYMLFLASLLLVGGALGDRWGLRRVFVLGSVVFAAASAACAAARTGNQLIVARGVQGVGAALLVPGSLALLSANFSKERRGRAIGTWASFTSVAAGVGPIIGAWLAESLSWRWIFILNIPIATAVVLVAEWRVPESRTAGSSAPLDWLGAALATAGLFGVVFGLIQAGARGFADSRVRTSLAAGALALGGLAVVEARSRNPMVPLSLFRSPAFAGANLVTFFLYAALGATMFVLPSNLIVVRGYSLVQASAALLPFVGVMFAMSRWAGGLMDRFGPRLPLTLGPSIAAVGFWLFSRSSGPDYWTNVLPAVLVMSVGMGITVAPLTATVMASAGEGAAGLASGINNAVSRVAALLSVAVVGVLVEGKFGPGLPRIALIAAGLAALSAISAASLIRPDGDGAGAQRR